MQEKVIRLGKQLIESFSAERHGDVDILSRWMAHYIAQQIVTAETATGEEKITAEERCFRTIVSIWKHRSNLPDGRRPFESFEPIFQSLARLHPDEPRPFYLARELVETPENPASPVNSLVQLALAADFAARAAIDVLLTEAAQAATSESVRAWLDNAMAPSLVSDVRATDVSVVTKLTERKDELDVRAQPTDEAARENIQRRIEKLDAFARLCQFVRDQLAKQLDSGDSDKLS
ncbi:MAG TPA: hypothetical protein VIW07_13265 [Candidatus Udaeobacter sp.]|jgi:hypothetical protein